MTFTVRAPASSANLGPGFDSLGLSVPLFTTLRVTPQQVTEVVPLGEELPAMLQYLSAPGAEDADTVDSICGHSTHLPSNPLRHDRNRRSSNRTPMSVSSPSTA